MSAAGAQIDISDTLENGHLPTQREQATTGGSQGSAMQNPQTKASDLQTHSGTITWTKSAFLGDLDKVSCDSQRLAVTRCLNSLTGGNQKPWKAYPGHNRLTTVDIDLHRTRKPHQFRSVRCKNEEVKDWLERRSEPILDTKGRRSSSARLNLLFVTMTGGGTASSSASDDANVLKRVFYEWGFPTAALSVLLDRRTTFIDQQIAPSTFKKAAKPSTDSTNRVFCAGMKQWVMIWSPSL
jgi:hypothetical protein